MQTIKQVLERKEEQTNLKHTGLLYLLVIMLIVLAFGMSNLNFSTREQPLETPVATTLSETNGD